MATSRVRITYEGKLALTIAKAAERHGVTPAVMRKGVQRLIAEGKLKSLPEGIDDRTPLFLASELDAAWRARPGKGANLRKSTPSG